LLSAGLASYFKKPVSIKKPVSFFTGFWAICAVNKR